MDHKEGSAWSRLFRLPHRLGAAAVAATLLTGAVLSAAYPALGELRDEKALFLSAAAEAEKNDLRPDQLLIYGGDPPAGYLFYNDLPQKLTSIRSLREGSAVRPGGVVVMFEDRKEVQSKFDGELKSLGVTLARRMAVKPGNSWRLREKGENYIVYTIEFPKKSTLKGAVQ